MWELPTRPVSQDFIHIDFYEIDMKRKIKVNVPVVTEGKSKGVELGGVLQIIRHDLEVLCFPGEIPEEIVIDITDLDMGDSVHVEEIPLEGDAEIQADFNYTVLTVLSPKVEEEEVEEEGVYYWSDIIGLAVYTLENEYLGRVASILQTGSNDVYVVKNEKGQ